MITRTPENPLANIDPTGRLTAEVFGHKLSSPLILGSGTLVEKYEEVAPFLQAGTGAVIPRTTRKVMERTKHPSPHLYQEGRRGQELMLNAEWTGAAIDYWRPYLERLAQTGRVIMSVSGRDIPGCTEVCKELDRFSFPLLEINVSCAHSNSVHGYITRNGQHIQTLIKSLKDAGVTTPIAIKLGHSDLIVELSNIAKEAGADAIVAINSLGPVLDFEIGPGGVPERILGIAGSKGGLTGSPLFHIALTDVAEIQKQVKIPVIACGGVSTAEQVLKMVMVGATAVEIYTAAHVKGIYAPAVFTQLNQKLIELLNDKGIPSLDTVRGSALSLLEEPTNLTPLVPELTEANCTGCDKCIPICLPQAISTIPSPNKAGHVIEINSDVCVGCGHCVPTCPTNALHLPRS